LSVSVSRTRITFELSYKLTHLTPFEVMADNGFHQGPRLLANSLQELDLLAEQLPQVSDATALNVYFNSSQNLLNKADEYRKQGDIERTYVFLLRFVIFVVQRLPKHKAYNHVEYTKLRALYRLVLAVRLFSKQK